MNLQQSYFLVTLLCYAAAVLLLWRSLLLKPFKLWTVFMHEFSHALAAWATCNTVTGIEVNADEGGLTHWKGHNTELPSTPYSRQATSGARCGAR